MLELNICKICCVKFRDMKSLSRHIKAKHKIQTKRYFDLYIEPFEHKCQFCDNERKFINLIIGYRQTCGSNACMRLNNISKQSSNEVKTKRVNTCLIKYGVENPFQSNEIKERIKQTNLLNLGVEHHFQADVVKEKIRQTKLEKYGNEHFLNIEKSKQTCKDRFGVENPFQAYEIKDRIKTTFLNRYGVENPSQIAETRSKAKQTCIERYGVDSYAKTEEYAKSVHKKYEYNGLSFDSKAEVEFYKYCEEKGLGVKYQPCSFKYTDSLGKEHVYFPDFEVNGILYEIKGDHLWKDGHVWFPYRNTLNEEQLKAIDARDLAKTECMKSNNVRVILTSEIDKLEKIIIF